MLELAALRRHIKIGRDGTLPMEPMKAGIDLSTAPNVIITLLGEFKGELGFKYHLMSLASTTSSGIKLRWWLETLIYGVVHANVGQKLLNCLPFKSFLR
jgi:hypothetical protein